MSGGVLQESVVFIAVVGFLLGGAAGCVVDPDRSPASPTDMSPGQPPDGDPAPSEPPVDPMPELPDPQPEPPVGDPPDPSQGLAPVPAGPTACNPAVLPADTLACVVFPPPRSRTDGEAITVRGVVMQGSGQDSDVVAVLVNGFAAEMGGDPGDRRWTVEVPLVPGDNLLTVAVKEASGALHDDVARVRVVSGRDTQVAVSHILAVDSPGNRVLVIDERTRALVAIDLATGRRAMIASRDVGSGPFWTSPVSLALLPATADGSVVALLGNKSPAELLAVDLVTGARTLISGQDRGQGVALESIAAVAHDAVGRRAIVVDRDADRVLAIDLDRGDRTVIAGPGRGAGPGLIDPTAVVIVGQRAMVVDEGLHQGDVRHGSLVWVDLVSGARSVFGPILNGPELDSLEVRGIAYDPARGRVVLALRHIEDVWYRTRIVVHDLDSGEQATLSASLGVPAAIGDGPPLWLAAGVAVDQSGRILTGESFRDTIYEIAPERGDRSLPWRDSGTQVTRPESVMLDRSRGRVLIADLAHNGLLALDLVTGEQTVMTDYAAADLFYSELHATLDPTNERALLVESWDGADDSALYMVTVDLRTGQRVDRTRFAIPSPSVAVAPDIHAGHVLFLSGAEYCYGGYLDSWAIDRGLGVRVAGAPWCDELPRPPDPVPDWGAPRDIAMDWVQQRAVIADLATATVFAVDRADTGGDPGVEPTRTVISDGTTGGGPLFERPSAVAMDPVPGRVIVGDELRQALFAVDAATGDRVIIADASKGRGPRPGKPRSIAVDSDNGVAFVIHNLDWWTPNQLMAVDLVTGDRVTIAP